MSDQSTKMQDPIAIVGISALFPGRIGTAGFWQDIYEGRNNISEVPANRWHIDDYFDPDPKSEDKTYGRTGGFLDTVCFDPIRFGIPPTSLPATDTSQLLALVAANEILNEVEKTSPTGLDKSRASVVLGVAAGTELLVHLGSRLNRPIWEKALRETGLSESLVQDACNRIANQFVPWQEDSFPGLLSNVVAGRISKRFDLNGSNYVVDAACASALAAVQSSILELRSGQADLVITGGVDTINDIWMYMCFSKTPALSPTGDCRPFSADADGTVLGEGIGMIALRRLQDAERDGNHIYAVIRGIGSASDGQGKSVYAPAKGGQVRALERAYEMAGFSPRSIELMEAHGSATGVGDVVEFEALNEVFGQAQADATQWCALGSVKSQIGHTKAAAGAAGLIKATLALHHKVLPPTIKVTRPNETLDFAKSPFYLNTSVRPWFAKSEYPRRAAVSAFGFGGTNFHVALEEYTGRGEKPPRLRTMDRELIALSAPSSDDLLARARLIETALNDGKSLQLTAVESQRCFDSGHAYRLALVARDVGDLSRALPAALEEISKSPMRGFTQRGAIAYGVGPPSGKTAFLFPGQGSQYPNMGSGLVMAFEAARLIWERAANLDEFRQAPLHEIVFPNPTFDEDSTTRQQACLREMTNAQPAIAAVCLSYLAVLCELGVHADCAAGHSFGELVALHFGGALSEPDLLRLARKRGDYMTEAAAGKTGGMLAVIGKRDLVEHWLHSTTRQIVLANDNSPEQAVLSGDVYDLQTAARELADLGLQVAQIPVATAMHSPLVSSATVPLARFLESLDLQSPARAVYSNVTAAPYAGGKTEIATQLAAQIARPVRFREQIEAMYRDGVRNFVEVGPGDVLTRLVSQCLNDRPHNAIATDRTSAAGVANFMFAIGQLLAVGVPVNLDALWKDVVPPETPAPERPQHVRIDGGNLGRPYPTQASETQIKRGARSVKPPRHGKSEAVASPVQEPVEVNKVAGLTEAAQAYEQRVASPVSGVIQDEPTTQKNHVSHSTQVAPSAAVQLHANLARAHEKFLDLQLRAHEAFLSASAELLSCIDPSVGLGTGLQSHSDQESQDRQVHQFADMQPQAADGHAAHNAMANNGAAAPLVGDRHVNDLEGFDVETPSVDIESRLKSIVSLETGYPQEALELGLEIEGDLGIDSIKQVQILSRLRQQLPALQEITPNQVSEFRTLGHIVDFLSSTVAKHADSAIAADRTISSGAGTGFDLPGESRENSDPIVSASLPNRAGTSAPIQSVAADTLRATICAIVAEETGYPTEVLELTMNIEADLGIDSIKQVQILSKLRQKMPHIIEIPPSKLAEIATLQDIIDHIEDGQTHARNGPAALQQEPAAVHPPARENGAKQSNGAWLLSDSQSVVGEQLAPSPMVSSEAINAGQLGDILRGIVASETGYPEDALDLSMDVEADLGIDSIKQVQILSQLRRKLPHLPEISPSKLPELRTLGAIANYLGRNATHRGDEDWLPDRDAQNVIAIANIHQTLSRSVVRTIETPVPVAQRPTSSAPGFVGITNHAADVAEQLQDALQQRGVPSAVVDNVPPEADTLIFTGGLQSFTRVSEAEDIHWDVLSKIKTMAEDQPGRDIRVVALQDTGGAFAQERDCGAFCWSAGLPGLIKTAHREWPHVIGKVIDIEQHGRTAGEVATCAATEVLNWTADVEVGHPRDGRRLKLVAESKPLPRVAQSVLVDDMVIVASGGGRGICADVLKAMAAQRRIRVAIMGRTSLRAWSRDLPETDDAVTLRRALSDRAQSSGAKISLPEIEQECNELLASLAIARTIAELSELGTDARYYRADVSDFNSVRNAVGQVRNDFGPIDGFLHAAGVLADKLIADKKREQLEAEFQPKVSGLQNLIDATTEDNLKFAMIFSSIAARTGNVGQAGYAMANEVVNRMAWNLAHRRPDCIIKALNWGPWNGGMVDDKLRLHFEEAGVGLIEPEAGAAAFVAELATEHRRDVEVLLQAVKTAS